MTREEFGTNIRQLRETQGWTQEDLARTAAVPTWAVTHAETGRSVGAIRLFAIANELGLVVPPEFDKPTKVSKSAKKKHSLDDAVSVVKQVETLIKPFNQGMREVILAAIWSRFEVKP